MSGGGCARDRALRGCCRLVARSALQSAPGAAAAALRLERLLFRRQWRRRLGPFLVELQHDRDQSVGRASRRHRRLQFPDRQSRARRRRRRRLVRLERQQHVSGLSRRLQHQATAGSPPSAAASVMRSIASCLTSPAALRSATFVPPHRASLAAMRPIPAGRLAPALKSRCRATGAPRRNILRVDLGSFNCTGCGALPPDNVSLQENVFRAGVNYHFGWGK